MKLAVVAGLVACAMVGAAHAGDGPHLVGWGAGYGFYEFDSGDGNAFDGGDGVNTEIWYRYMLSDIWGMELGYGGGESGVMSAIFAPINDLRNLDYHGPRVSVYGRAPLYRGGNLYAKLGYGGYAISYDYKKVRYDTHDRGFVGAFGFEHRFRNGFGLHAEWRRTYMEKLDSGNINAGISWRF